MSACVSCTHAVGGIWQKWVGGDRWNRVGVKGWELTKELYCCVFKYFIINNCGTVACCRCRYPET